MQKQTFREALRETMSAQRSMGHKGANWDNQAVAYHTLLQDLGYYSDHNPSAYGLDENVRDTLIAHARQDAAHAVVNTASLLKEMRIVRILLIAIVCLLVIIILAEFSIWR
jgi:hypothetical protein